MVPKTSGLNSQGARDARAQELHASFCRRGRRRLKDASMGWGVR